MGEEVEEGRRSKRRGATAHQVCHGLPATLGPQFSRDRSENVFVFFSPLSPPSLRYARRGGTASGVVHGTCRWEAEQLASACCALDFTGDALLAVLAPGSARLESDAATCTGGPAPIVCPADCSGHGTCIGGVCHCDQRYAGPACADLTCPNDCSGHGTCDYATRACRCDAHWFLADCSHFEATGCAAGCSGHGSCVAGVCQVSERAERKLSQACVIARLGARRGGGEAQWTALRGLLILKCVHYPGSFAHSLAPSQCDYGWGGPDGVCADFICPHTCAHGGTCRDDACICPPTFHQASPCGSQCPKVVL